MPYISVHVDFDDILEEVPTEDLLKELQSRRIGFSDIADPEQIEHSLEELAMNLSLHRHTEVVESARNLLWHAKGRIIN